MPLLETLRAHFSASLLDLQVYSFLFSTPTVTLEVFESQVQIIETYLQR